MPPRHSRFAILTRVLLLPLALSWGTVSALGSYCETSDDISLAWLFSGILALKPVPTVPLYLHGFGRVLAALYATWPGVAWLGGLLGGLLTVATVLVFAVLDRLLRPYLRPGPLAVALTVFFGLAWVEHWLWFSHVRVVLLLAGAAVLFAAQRPARRTAWLVGLAGLGAAWLVRPSLAVLGLVAVLPAAVLLAGGWRRAAPVLVGAAVVLALATGAGKWLQTNAEAHTQARDASFARVLDFDQLRPQPRTSADSLGTVALSHWLLGDSTLVNEAMCRRAYAFDAADFWSRTAPAKLWLRLGLLGRDYFPLLLALAAVAVGVARRRGREVGFWLVQIGFAGGLILCAVWLKLPSRLVLPMLDFWVLTNLLFLLKNQAPAALVASQTTAAGTLENALPMRPPCGPVWWPGPLASAALVLVALLYGIKTWHRGQVLGQERQRHEETLAEISRRTAGHCRVLAGTNDLLKSLSPFRVYDLGFGPTLLLSGWPAHDPSQPALRHYLTGTTDQTNALRHLANPHITTQWLLSAETAYWLNRRLRYRPGPGPLVQLRPERPLVADTSLRFYQPVWP